MSYSPFVAPGGDDLGVNSYSSVGGATHSQTVMSQYNLYKPNELVQVFERHAGRPSFRLMLKAMGFNRGTAKNTTGHYEYPWRKNLVPVGAIITASTGPGTPVVIELDPSGMYNASVTVGGAARQASYPRVNDTLVFIDGEMGIITAKNTAVTPHQLTIVPVDPAVDLVTSIVVGEEYFISSNAWGEGTGLPDGIVPRVIQYHNTFQIVKEAVSATGSEMTNQTYFNPVPGQEGSFYLQVKWTSMMLFEDKCDGALMWGQAITNPAIATLNPNVGFDVQPTGTEGLMEFATTNGNNDTYTVGAYAMSDFDDLGKYFTRERVGVKDMICLQGIDIRYEIENVLGTLLNGDMGSLLTSKYFYGDNVFSDGINAMDSRAFAMEIGFRGVQKGGINFGFYELSAFNENVGAGAPGYDYPNYQIIFPVGYAADKETGSLRPTIGYEYKLLGGYSREEVIADLAGVGVAGTGTPYRVATSPNDIHQMGMVSEIAFHGTCANHITIQRP